jgi:predicted TIM-barrel fold metal-dependent hydrolase
MNQRWWFMPSANGKPDAAAPPWRIVAAMFACLLAGGCASFIDAIGGASSREPSAMQAALSPEARELVQRAYADVDPTKLLDYHTHLLGMGEGGSGCYVNESALNWGHPLRRMKFLVYRSAAKITDETRAETEYLERLIALARLQRGRFVVLAFDEYHDVDGRPNRARSEFHVPNDYAMAVATSHPDLFVPACSIHPYRPDALAELERCAARGVRIIKWLPNAMGIDPADERVAPFFARMRALDMALLSHAGEEAAVDADEDQHLGNPLRLRAALAAGVRVIATHFAGLGEAEDLDRPEKPRVPAWRLLLRMIEDPRWKGLLFADISAVTQANRTPEPLVTLLTRSDLHSRLVNGSDYPLPAVNMLIRTSSLEAMGLISPVERRALNEVYNFNPLVFDYVLKRTVRAVGPDGVAHRFARSIFEENPALSPAGQTWRRDARTNLDIPLRANE